MARRAPATDDPDDFFADTRMSFGDHIEELRTRLFKAIKGLVFFLLIGFVLDGVGYLLERPNIGIGRPMFALLTKPVEDMVRDYYHKQNATSRVKLPSITRLSDEEAARIQKILDENEGHIAKLPSEDRDKLIGRTEMMPIIVKVEDLEKHFGPFKEPKTKEIEIPVQVYPAYQSFLASQGESLLQTRKYLTTLSVQEPFLVYMKVSMLCGLVLGSPYIFYQIWAFVAAGLYPHERKYVHVYMPFSIGLFLTGCVICQFLVVPTAVQSLLGLNSFLGTDPDIRLNEWLSFALILPLVFGVSFQTPLIMLFLNRIGIFSHEDYIKYWRGAAFFLAVAAVIVLPAPDVMTMMYLYVPMFALYLLGIALCKYFPKTVSADTADESSQVAI